MALVEVNYDELSRVIIKQSMDDETQQLTYEYEWQDESKRYCLASKEVVDDGIIDRLPWKLELVGEASYNTFLYRRAD